MPVDLMIKIGGSCLSDKILLYKALKSQDQSDIQKALNVNSENIEKIATELGNLYKSYKRMIILTGVGSPGHFTVLRFNLHKGNDGTFKQHMGLLEAQIAVNKLRQTFLEALLRHNVPGVQFYASSMYISNSMRIVSRYTLGLEGFLKTGMVPIISGDMVSDKNLGYSVLSGDQILLDLARKFQPKKIIFGSDVDGVYDSDPKQNKQAQLIREISSNEIDAIIKNLAGTDASGQMKGKLIEIKNLINLGFKNIFLLNLTKEGTLTNVALNGKGLFTRFY